MAKKKEIEQVGSILSMTLEDVMEDRFAAYAKDIIQDRALPDARDGLKPAQRRIIYSMHLEGNVYNKPTRKSAKTVGNVIGTLHPHGDSSVYEAMVRMSQDWKMRLPLVEMQGNNGSIDDDPAAAMRYTEARLSKAADLLTADLDKDTVQWAPNYDDTMKEPTVLPARFPNLLVNGAKGIAEGYSTEIAPHNLNEVIDACIYLIRNPGAELSDLMEIIPGPDFPTGGVVQGKEGIREAFKSGRGSIIVRGKAEIVNKGKASQLVITEIPFDVIKHDLIKRINKVRFEKEIDGIAEVLDESDLSGLKIVVDVKEGVDPQLILNYLYKRTNLQTTYNYNMVAIVDRCPRQMGLIDMLEAFIAHRRDVITRRTRYDLAKKEERCHIIQGLIKAVSVLDEVIKTIRHSKDKPDSKKNLMARFGFSDLQAEAIVMMQLYRLSNTDILQLKNEYALLSNEIARLKDILSNPEILDQVMISELEAINHENPQPRRTRIEDAVEEIVIDKAKMISSEQVMLTVSRDGYVKRVSLRSYNSLSAQPTGLKENDELIGAAEASTLDTLAAWTDQGNYLLAPVYQLDEGRWKDIGTHVGKYVKLNNSEKIIDAAVLSGFESYCWILTVSAKGRIKRTPLEKWQLQRFSRTSSAIALAPGDRAVRSFAVYPGDEVMILTREGYCVRYGIDQIPSISCHGSGVIAMNLGAADEIVYAGRVSPQDTDAVIFTDEARAKRIKLSEFEPSKRPKRGLLAAKPIKSRPVSDRYLFIGRTDSKLTIANSRLSNYQFTEIPLMAREATFSQPLFSGDPWFAYRGIDVIMKVPKPKNPERQPSNDDFDLISFKID